MNANFVCIVFRNLVFFPPCISYEAPQCFQCIAKGCGGRPCTVKATLLIDLQPLFPALNCSFSLCGTENEVGTVVNKLCWPAKEDANDCPSEAWKENIRTSYNPGSI